MKSFRTMLAALGAAATLAGCMHHHDTALVGAGGGDIAIDSVSATKTAVLRVDNASDNVVRVYMVKHDMQPIYIAKAMPGKVQTWLLDPQEFPATRVVFKTQAEGGSMIPIGPFDVLRNQTVEIVVPKDAAMAHGRVHQTLR